MHRTTSFPVSWAPFAGLSADIILCMHAWAFDRNWALINISDNSVSCSLYFSHLFARRHALGISQEYRVSTVVRRIKINNIIIVKMPII